MTNNEMFALIRAQADQPAPRRDTDLDRQFEYLRANDPAFAAFFNAYWVYRSDLEYWCKWTQNGAFDVAGDRPARPDGVAEEYEQDILAFYRLA